MWSATTLLIAAQNINTTYIVVHVRNSNTVVVIVIGWFLWHSITAEAEGKGAVHSSKS